MTPEYQLRLSSTQYDQLRAHLFPGDGLKAVALILCGRRVGDQVHALTAREIINIPYDHCDRRKDRVTWPTTAAEHLLMRNYGRRQAVVKVHSHPVSVETFSSTDTASDQELLAEFASFQDDALPHASCVMLPDGSMFGRVLVEDGTFRPLSLISVVGDDLLFWPARRRGLPPAFAVRQAQAFGDATIDLVRSLSVAVVGCSGTGSVVVEQLARLGFRRLVLVDHDEVEEKNLNRIINAGKEDVYLRGKKVHVLASAIARMGLGQEVIPVPQNLATAVAVRAVAQSDIVFGCMDGVEGRHLLNRLCTFYNLPYIDVGVKLDADGKGGITTITGAVHYLQPGRSSLHSREVYTLKTLEAEELRRTNPAMFAQQVQEGYVRGVVVDRPAVISINTFFAALAVNELLARIHPYRNQPNAEYAAIRGNLAEVQFFPEPEGQPCPLLQRHVGRGDVTPLLDRPVLS